MATTKYWTGAVSGDASLGGNWSDGVAPAVGDTLWFIDNDRPVNAGLDMTANDIAAIYFDMTYSGDVGTDSAYLQIQSPTVYVGTRYGTKMPPVGSKMLKIDGGNGLVDAVHVFDTSKVGRYPDLPPFIFKAIGGSCIVYQNSGSMGIGILPGETANLLDLFVGKKGESGSPHTIVGVGATVITNTIYSGVLDFRGLTTTIQQRGGVVNLDTADPTISTYSLSGGTAYMDRHQTITAFNSYGGLADWTRTPYARAVTTLTMYAGRAAAGYNEYPGGTVIYHPYSSSGLSVTNLYFSGHMKLECKNVG